MSVFYSPPPKQKVHTPPQSLSLSVVVMGDTGVGKTSLIRRWTREPWSPTVEPTIHVDIGKYCVTQIKDQIISLDISEIGGNSHQDTSIHSTLYLDYVVRCADIIILVANPSVAETVQHVQSHWLPFARSNPHECGKKQVYGIFYNHFGGTSFSGTGAIGSLPSPPGVPIPAPTRKKIPEFDINVLRNKGVNEALESLLEKYIAVTAPSGLRSRRGSSAGDSSLSIPLHYHIERDETGAFSSFTTIEMSATPTFSEKAPSLSFDSPRRSSVFSSILCCTDSVQWREAKGRGMKCTLL